MNTEERMCAPFCEASHCRGTEVILLVEDEAFVRKVTAEVLESAGYTLLITDNPADARKAYRKHGGTINLLLADVVMPGMSGRELAAEFERLYPRSRVLLMSGYAEQFARDQFSTSGSDCMAKPFSMRTLLKRVREVLDANSCGCGVQA